MLALTPYVEKELGRLTWRVVNKKLNLLLSTYDDPQLKTNVGEDNAVLVIQSIIVAYVVKTCKL